MESSLALQIAINLVMLTSIYALIALGLNLIYGMLRIVQFAHGQLFMIGAFIVWVMCANVGLNYYLSLLITTVIVGLASLVMERFFYRPLKGSVMPSLLMGIGLLMGLEGAFRLGFGGREHYIENPLPGTLHFFDVTVPQSRLLIMGVAIACIIVMFLFLKKTKMGQAMRAVAQDTEAASFQGIDVNRVRPLGFAIASGLAGLAGGLMMTITYVTPYIGSPLVIKGLLIIVLGGMGSLTGAVLGALVLGTIDSLALTFIGEYAALLSYVLVMIILAIRPRGLLGGTY